MPSCFSPKLEVNVAEWAKRFSILREVVNKWLITIPVKEAVTQVDLFFSAAVDA